MRFVKSWMAALTLGLAVSTQAATPVKVKSLSDVWQALTFQAPAEVVNQQHATLSAEIAGVLKQLYIQVGDQLKQGDLIADIECSDYRLALTQAEQQAHVFKSQLSLAEQQSRRVKVLQSSGSASKELLDQRKTEVDGLKAQLNVQQAIIAQAVKNTQRCQLTAPFSGVVTSIDVAQGNWLGAGTPVIRLLDTEQAEVSALLSREQVMRLQKARSIQLKVQDTLWPLTLRVVVPWVNSASKMQEVRLSFDEQAQVLTGAAGELLWTSPERILPARYLVNKEGLLGVMLLKGQQAEFVELPSAKEGQPVVIRLPAESQLIVQGQHVLKHGDAVTVSE